MSETILNRDKMANLIVQYIYIYIYSTGDVYFGLAVLNQASFYSVPDKEFYFHYVFGKRYARITDFIHSQHKQVAKNEIIDNIMLLDHLV